MSKKNKKGFAAVIYFVLCLLIGAALGFFFGDSGEDAVVPVSIIVVAFVFVFFALKNASSNQKKSKEKKEKELKRQAEKENLDIEKLDKIIQYLKDNSGKTVYRITTEEGNVSLDDSKFGGYPYWPKDEVYPASPRGEKLLLLAQINFTKECFEEDPLPKEGILQFFVLDDDYVGCNFFGEEYEIGNYRIVYHKSVKDPLSVEEMKESGIPATVALDQKESSFPFFSERRMIFEKGTDYISSCDSGFDELIAKALKELFNEELTESPWEYFNYTEYEYICDPVDTFGHKILGYPAFTQTDPRTYAEEITEEMGKYNTAYYDTLLLQLDSQDDQMWGDCGVANFFINGKALKELDFSDVFYTWDCC